MKKRILISRSHHHRQKSLPTESNTCPRWKTALIFVLPMNIEGKHLFSLSDWQQPQLDLESFMSVDNFQKDQPLMRAFTAITGLGMTAWSGFYFLQGSI